MQLADYPWRVLRPRLYRLQKRYISRKERQVSIGPWITPWKTLEPSWSDSHLAPTASLVGVSASRPQAIACNSSRTEITRLRTFFIAVFEGVSDGSFTKTP